MNLQTVQSVANGGISSVRRLKDDAQSVAETLMVLASVVNTSNTRENIRRTVEVNRDEILRRFPNASEAFIRQNADGEQRVCLECKKPFWFRDVHRQGKGDFCSQPCAARFTGRNTMSENRLKIPRQKLVKKICPTCKTEFESWASANRKYCCQKCGVKTAIAKGLLTKKQNGNLIHKNTFSNCKRGVRVIGGKKIFARSSWEANYARYLQFLKERGEIVDWSHEKKTFWFETIKRGCRSYTPDFEVITVGNGELLPYNRVEYHEVKGWMTSRSKTSIKRMRIYHPTVRLVVIDQVRYKGLARSVAGFIPGWE